MMRLFILNVIQNISLVTERVTRMPHLKLLIRNLVILSYQLITRIIIDLYCLLNR